MAAESREDLYSRIDAIVLGAFTPNCVQSRTLRASIIGSASESQKYRDALAVE